MLVGAAQDDFEERVLGDRQIACRRPVDLRDHHGCRIDGAWIEGQVALDHVECRLRLQRGLADALGEDVVHIRVLDQIAPVGDGAEPDGETRKAACATGAGETFEIAVGCDVVRLSGVADECRRRREQDEVVDLVAAGQLIENRGTLGLGVDDRPVSLAVEVADQRVVEHHCGMDDRAQRCHGAQRLEQALRRCRIGDVAGMNRGGYASLRPSFDHCRRFGVRQAAA